MGTAADDFQVLIIGAGPAGTAAALHLQENGRTTCLCDRATFPRAKSCGGLLEKGAFTAIEHTSPHARIAEFSEVDIKMPRGPSQRVDTATVLIDRARFDLDRLQYCQNSGVTVREGYSAVSIRQDRDQVVTSFSNGQQIRSQAVVAADGSGSLARKELQLPSGFRAVTLQTEIPAGQKRPQRPLIKFFAESPGYGWIFPGHDRLNVGVYSLHNRGVHALFQAFLSENGVPQRSGKGSFVLLRKDSATAGSGRVLLAGDAAGLANPLTGGGLQAALYSGRAAAASLLQRDPEQALPHYQSLLSRLTERPFARLAFAQFFYKKAEQLHSYKECLAAARRTD